MTEEYVPRSQLDDAQRDTLLVRLDTRQERIMSDIQGIKTKQVETNGLIAEVDRRQERFEGGLSVVKFMLGIMVGAVSAGAALALVILAILAT